VELLVQNGADYSYETNTGNTPLIEAVKSGNLEVVTYLAKAGALARYKTLKHRKSAYDWSKVLKFKMIERTLEIFGIVQSQVGEIFKLIACGEVDKVKALIQDGDFFNPQNSLLLTKKLNELFEESDETENRVVSLKAKIADNDKSVRKAQHNFDKLVAVVESLESKCQNIRKTIEQHETEIHIAFKKFEASAAATHKSDLEELVRMKSPGITVRLAVMIFGIMYTALLY